MSIEKILHRTILGEMDGWPIATELGTTGIDENEACEIADVLGSKLVDLIRTELTSDDVVEAVAEALPDLHWCESNYTRGCNCLDDRRHQARAALEAAAITLGGE